MCGWGEESQKHQKTGCALKPAGKELNKPGKVYNHSIDAYYEREQLYILMVPRFLKSMVFSDLV